MLWLAFSAAVIAALGGLWWYAWLRRNRNPPTPSLPYRQWKD